MALHMDLRGMGVALITPFNADKSTSLHSRNCWNTSYKIKPTT